MITKVHLGCLLLCGLPFLAPLHSNAKGIYRDDFVLMDTVTAKADALVVPFEKYRLTNGLTVILVQDKSDPIVAVDVTYHVGSAREEIGRTGLAHFFEHMMFQGSQNVADEEHLRIVTEAGGIANGATSSDFTKYFETVPSNQLEKMIWLEADRMGFLLPAVTQESFEIQRATVKNERAQNVEGRPYGLIGEKVAEALYPEGHPYSWLPIGHVDDLDRVDATDLKAFFQRWYGPNNATLTIGGDFDHDKVLAWVVKYFGSIQRGPDVEKPVKTRVSLNANRYISMEDSVSLPLLYKVWPTIYSRHDDEAPLDVLMNIMGTGKTSLLHKNLVVTGLAVQARAGHACNELSCTFTIQALPNPSNGATLSDLDRNVLDSLVEFERRGVQADDLARTKAQIRAKMIYGLESVAGKVGSLAYWQTLFGDANLLQSEIDRYDAVTAADVMRVYRKYLKGRPAVTLSVVPNGHMDMVAKPINTLEIQRSLYEDSELGVIENRVSNVRDDFDRSIQPEAGAIPPVTIPKLWRSSLANGIEVVGTVLEETPTTTIQIRLKVGQRSEPLNKLGLASLTTGMLNESTRRSSSEEISNRLQKLGSSVQAISGKDYTTINVRSLTQNLDKTLDIAREILLEPAFTESDFKRLRNQVIENIRSAKNDGSAVAENVRSLLLYGNNNSFSYPDTGLDETVLSLTVQDVRDFYDTFYSPSVAKIVTASNLSQADITTKLARFGDWQGADVEIAPVNQFPELANGTLFLVDKPGAAQSELRIAKRALSYDAVGTFYRLGLVEFPLGGTFNSRINLNLREDKGYTYGVSAGFGGNEYAGSFTASTSVRRDATAEAIRELLKEIDRFATYGMTEAELLFAKASIGQRNALAYETPVQKVELIGDMLNHNLKPQYLEEQQNILADMSLADTNKLAKEQLQTSEMIVIVVGDKAAIYNELRSLSMPIVQVDELGIVIADSER